MNKSVLTNVVSAAVVAASFLLPAGPGRELVFATGIFALSGALTNWLAVHMLFERVPGLYGSGVIVEKFAEFKTAIRELVMDNFFTEENFFKFADAALHQGFGPAAIRKRIDGDAIFEEFVGVVVNSKFGAMLKMFGGPKALESLREPFKMELEKKVVEIVETLDLTKSHGSFESFRPTVESLVIGKLDELQAEEVKAILERMIRQHLGWLVVWGGVGGALIGIVGGILQIAAG